MKAKTTVLALGAVENARLMLASRDVAAAGVGNANDLVGRFFADHPIPRDTATLVSFAGDIAGYYFNGVQSDTARCCAPPSRRATISSGAMPCSARSPRWKAP